ncbi:MAG: ATP-binding cassette domain-containing protein, partial [Ureaplasma sp.]|nr:ATP-binding cassette domain-containing protein [Ureaplasma sp.]
MEKQIKKKNTKTIKSKPTNSKITKFENAKYAIEMIDITKTFLNGKVIANDKVNLRVKENEVHAIIGENGAGKSTLMSMLFGIYSPDSGIIKINGNQVNFSSAKDASDIGLGMVHQHFKLIDEFTVWENIILGNEGTSRLKLINQRRIKQEIQNLINLYGFKLDVNKKVSDLTVGQQQKIEILKLLYRKADILIFDEPTAVLSQDEIEAFFDMIRQFKNLGKTIIIITHKLAEIKSIADSGTVIRRGKYIDSFAIKDRTIDQIAELMVGHKLLEIKNQHHDISNNEIKFSVENLP